MVQARKDYSPIEVYDTSTQLVLNTFGICTEIDGVHLSRMPYLQPRNAKHIPPKATIVIAKLCTNGYILEHINTGFLLIRSGSAT